MNDYILNVDLKRSMTSIIPTYAQKNKITLYFRVFDNGISYDYLDYLKSEIKHRLPSGKLIKGFGEIVNLNGENLIRYTYDGDEMMEIGYVKTNLTIHTYSSKVSIRNFKIKIYENIKLNIN